MEAMVRGIDAVKRSREVRQKVRVGDGAESRLPCPPVGEERRA